MSITFCMAQSKGGTGKTTSTLNIGAALVHRGYKVLGVDIDQQANLTVSLGVDPLSLPKTMRALLTDESVKAEELVVETEEGIDIIPSNLDLAFVELAMQPVAREKVLARKLEPLKENYDFILIDTPPSFGTTVINAMASADYLLVPVQPEPLCIYGLSLLLENVDMVKRTINPDLSLLGLFVTLYKDEAAHIQLTERLRQDWSDYVFNQVIRDSAMNDRTILEGRSIVSSRPKAGLAKDYVALTEEILGRVNQ